ncbi:hypothetical protein AB1Y20_006607 [Prymnesium parvum]|uniref:Class I SAM-dependent methyltransferase n=1 Tax=Prymnesium parvum TaxID=97485 RepID=A0AB34IYK8_PRYPA
MWVLAAPLAIQTHLAPPSTCFRNITSTRATTSRQPILPAAAPVPWRPVCTTSCCNPQLWPRNGKYCRRCDDRRCMQGDTPVGCCTAEKDAGTLARGARKTTRGGWQLQASYTYFLDRGLVAAIGTLVAGASVIELGAGMGCYTAALHDLGTRSSTLGPLEVRGFDGAPGVVELTEGLVGEADLTTPLQLNPADWVLSLEVGEHVPKRYEPILFATLTSLARRGIILSWSNHRGGRGHVNPRPHKYIAEQLFLRGFYESTAASKALARRASVAYWIGSSIAVYQRNHSHALAAQV